MELRYSFIAAIICTFISINVCYTQNMPEGIFKRWDEALKQPLKVKALVFDNLEEYKKINEDLKLFENLELFGIVNNNPIPILDALDEIDTSKLISFPLTLCLCKNLVSIRVIGYPVLPLPNCISNLNKLEDLYISILPTSDFKEEVRKIASLKGLKYLSLYGIPSEEDLIYLDSMLREDIQFTGF